MKKKIYITEEESAKCRKVADAFAELCEMENIVILDVGRFGYEVLKYYSPILGFDEQNNYTDSKKLFEDLWKEWLDTKLFLMFEGTQLLEDEGFEGVFKSLSKEEQEILTGRKADFAKAAEICI